MHRDTPTKPAEKGLLLGIVIISFLVACLVAGMVVGGSSGPHKNGTDDIITGIYLQTWGLLFLLSYFFDHKCFFFRWLMWICQNFSSPKGRGMAFFYFALAFGLGTAAILTGLGVL